MPRLRLVLVRVLVRPVVLAGRVAVALVDPVTAVLDAPHAMGSTIPRIYTRPVVGGPPGPCGCGCALAPATSWGFQAIEFAESVLGLTLLPWQRWWLIHALELRSDGSFRFRTIVTLVARQNGKTHLLKIVALYFLFMDHARLILGAAQSLDIAREAWQGAVDMTRDVDDLHAEVQAIRQTNGEQEIRLVSGARYRISATHRSAGRGLSVDLLILDELREHRDWLSWAALSNTTRARPNALTVGISNAGDLESVVLNTLRSTAMSGTEESVGLFEWSAPDGAALDDVAAWAAANPGLGYTISEGAIRSSMSTDPASVFRTETMCQAVDSLEAPVDLAAWAACADPSGSLADVRDRLVLCLDIAPDSQHVSLVAAALLDDGRVRVEVMGAWPSTDAARRGLTPILAALRPRALGWFPAGPATVFAVDLAEQHAVTVGRQTLHHDGMLAWAPGVVELSGQTVTEVCQTAADQVQMRQVLHPNDPLLNAHVSGSRRLRTGDGWRFARRGAGHCDAAYAFAGAVHLARSLPAARARTKSRVF